MIFNLMKFKILAVLFVLVVPTICNAEPADRESIKELLTLTGAANLGEQMVAQMLPAMKQAMPNAPEEFWAEFKAEADVNELVDSIIPIYQKYLTKEDVTSLNEFYKSKIGQKMIKLQPLLMRETMQVGQAWGQAAGRRAMQNLKKDGK
jgi:uncharacterized protein